MLLVLAHYPVISTAHHKWVVRKCTQLFMALDSVHNDACTNRNEELAGVGHLFTSWATVNVSKECSTELFVTGWMDLLQSVKTDGCVSPFFFIRRLEAQVAIYVSAVLSVIPTANCRTPNRLNLFLGSCGWWHGVIAYRTTNKVSKSRRPQYGTSPPCKAQSYLNLWWQPWGLNLKERCMSFPSRYR